MNTRVCIILSSNLKHSTLISHYTSILETQKIEYDLIYFDRYNIEEKSTAKNVYKYTEIIESNQSQFKKLPTFLSFRKFVINILKKNNYKLIITWNTLTAMLIFSYLKKHNISYIHNIRDYFNEENHLIAKYHKLIIKNSLFSTISSEGFRKFLPSAEYTMLHSVNENIISSIKPKKLSKQIPYKIGFVGNVRFLKDLKKFIKIFSNDPRFELWFCGTNSEKLEKFIEDKGIWNVRLEGPFKPEQTKDIISNMDMINNIFGNESIAVNTLTSIRLYHSSFMYKPILVNNDTHLESIVNSNNIGLSIDLEGYQVKEKVFEWYSSFDTNNYIKNSNKFNKKILDENLLFKKKFNEVLRKVY